jgi:nucleoside-diphosphate-sugar epimerase
VQILLTGITGFVGTTLIQHLKSTTQFELHPTLRLPVLGYPQATVVGSINHHTDWTTALQGIDTVIHLAARAHQINDTHPNPEQAFYEVNTAGTANLVQQSIEARVKHFIFISSIGAMATLSDQVLTADSPCQPDTPYGRSKLAAEQALIQKTQGTGMTYTIIRPPLVYGPGNPGNMERLIKLVYTGYPLPLGAIHNRRSLVALPNLIDLITTCLTHPAATNQTFLVSDNEDLSTTGLIKRLAKALDKPARLLPIPMPLLQSAAQIIGKPDLAQRLCGSLQVDISKTQSLLDWTPPVSVDQGLRMTAQHFQPSRKR